MRKEEIQVAISEEVIIRKIYSIRGKQVMLSQDLAELYEVETRVLNQQVKRNEIMRCSSGLKGATP